MTFNNWVRTNPTLSLTRASMKIWLRDRQAILWTFFLPLILILVFGILDFGSFGGVHLGIVDRAGNDTSRGLLENIRDLKTFDISDDTTEAEERQALLDGDRDLVLIIGPDFGATDLPGQREVTVLYNQGQAREAQAGQTIVQQVLDEMTFADADVSNRFRIDARPVNSRNLRFIEFLLPGIIGMSIMQMSLFSVAFTFVQMKNRGILRRLLATPVRPASFLFAQVATRLMVSLLQTLVLVGVAVIFFDVKVVGSLGAILVLALIGGTVFISLGFAISGWARSEEVAAPLANLIALPMMFLSGVFFPRDALPGGLSAVADYLPLSFLTDALRAVAVDGEVLWSQWGEVAGLAVWMAVSFYIAVRLFRWE